MRVLIGVVASLLALTALARQDADRDGDGIPDSRDLCPIEAEDFDGFEDDDGCPDPDNDRDGIPDAEDHCPNEPETVNGYQDEDGCPDQKPPPAPPPPAPKKKPSPPPKKKARPGECSTCWTSKCPDLRSYWPPCE